MTGPRYSQGGVQGLKHGGAAFRAGDRIVPAREAEGLLAAVEGLPPAHDCPGLAECDDHPRWHAVCAPSYFRRGWNLYAPNGAFHGWMPTLPRTVGALTERARADQLAAITHSEGTDALPADLETP